METAGQLLSDFPHWLPKPASEICPVHGIKKTIYLAGWDGETQVRCDSCDDEAQRAEVAAKLRELELHRIKCLLKLIPQKYASIMIGQLLQRPCCSGQLAALQKLSDWGKLVYHQSYLMLTIVGEMGCGKTEMACGLIGSFLRMNPPVQCRYTTCYDLSREVTATWRKSSECSEAEVVRAYIDPKVLVIDDVAGVKRNGEDKEKQAAALVALLETIIDARYLQGKKTVLIGNIPVVDGQVSKEHLVALIGERGASRATDNGVTIRCQWPTQRRWAEKDAFEADVASSGVQLC
jgi:hypothetical protein